MWTKWLLILSIASLVLSSAQTACPGRFQRCIEYSNPERSLLELFKKALKWKGKITSGVKINECCFRVLEGNPDVRRYYWEMDYNPKDDEKYQCEVTFNLPREAWVKVRPTEFRMNCSKA